MSSKDFVIVECSVASDFANSELMLLLKIAATISVEPFSTGPVFSLVSSIRARQMNWSL